MNRMLTVALALASGYSHAGLPKPQGTELLHAEQQGYAVQAYEVQGTAGQALAAYARVLQDAGLRVRTIDGALAVRGSHTAIVHAFREDGHTVLALVRLGDEEQTRDDR
ncbi:MAG: hypothetical protein ABW352_11045 [Polyangiales bacterium]